MLQFLLHPEEARIPATDIEWIEIDYQKEDSWMAWFFVVSTASALAFGRLV